MIRWLYRHQDKARAISTLAAVLICATTVGLVLHYNGQQSAGAAHLAREGHRIAEQGRHIAEQSRHTAFEARRLAQEIQANRLALCRSQNRAHRNTIRVLRADFRKAQAQEKMHAERAAGQAGFKEVVVLFDNAIPKKNCERELKSKAPRSSSR